MNLFFDTSALVKLFHDEVGTAKVTEWVDDSANTVWLLDLAKLEFASALHRRFRSNEIGEYEMDIALEAFSEQLSSFHIEAMGRSVVEEAEDLVNQHGKTMGLRTLDALHLGAFLLISEEDWYFVAADKNLCKVATASIALRRPSPQPGEGNVLFKLSDIYTGTLDTNDELIQGLSDAKIRLQNEAVLTIDQTLTSDDLGEALFTDLPSGSHNRK